MILSFKKEVLAQLRTNGSDTNKPHVFEFYLYIPRKDYAGLVKEKMLESKFSEVKVQRAASGKGWMVVAQRTLVPQKADLNDNARFLNEVAAAVGGDFDGWEAELVPK